MTRIGFIGLGHMGGPMCERVLAAGFPTTAFDLDATALARAESSGARAAASAAACACEADVLITMLPGPAQVEDVLLGSGRALDALPPGALSIDMSTSSPRLGRQIAEEAARRGLAALEAPVADALRAPEGMLHVFVGGEAADLARARPVLETMGDPDRIVHVGPAGAGHTTKLLVNLQWFVHAAAAAEALVVGARAGLDVRTLHTALVAGPARCSFLEHEALEVLEDGEYGERFPLGLVAKDLALALELVHETEVPAELSSLTERVYAHARERLGDDAGEMGVVRLYEELTGTDLRFAAA